MLENLFSIKKEGLRKVITLLGVKIKLKDNNAYLQDVLEELLLYARRENPHKDISIQPAQNLKLHMAKIAADESARFIMKNCITAPAFRKKKKLLSYALSKVEVEGKYLEFGVWKGNTINHIATKRPNETIYGFDSFEGLPEDWQATYPKGYFKVDSLPAVKQNVKLIKGWFDETLPKFLKEQGDFKVAFIHNDSDLYSSTKTMFNCLKNHIQNGTVIVFDELLNYPGWEDNEYKALTEFLDDTGYKVEYLGYVSTGKQMAIKLYK